MSSNKTRSGSSALLLFLRFTRSLMTAFLLSICALDRCLALFNEYRQLNHGQVLVTLVPKAASVRRRRTVVAHHRRPSSPLPNRHRHHTRHSSSVGGRHSLTKINKKHHLGMASHSEIRRRSSAADRVPIEPSVISSTICAAPTSTFIPTPEPPPSPPPLTTAMPTVATPSTARARKSDKHRSLDGSIMPLREETTALPPSTNRHCRTTSSSRITNRLSLTLPIALPIALPNSESSRSTPTTTASTPSLATPTPEEPSALPSPSNVNEFIIAIAAKERKVLELRETLAREEAELAILKKNFSSGDALYKRDTTSHRSVNRMTTPIAVGDPQSPRCSVDMDRRNLLLHHQGTPTQTRRTAFRGRHTRTLSLLSPARTGPEFSVLHGNGEESIHSPIDQRAAQGANSMLAKRASWQPRSQQNAPVVPQLMEDFKLGFRAFVEDIRQITIGDEPVNGSMQSLGTTRAGSTTQAGPSDQVRSKNGQLTSSVTANLAPLPSQTHTLQHKARPMKSNKHFSWTPLGFDSMDDTDWANWESPTPAKSTRWSGSTVHSEVMEDIQSIPESEEHNTSESKNLETPILSPTKLEEMLPNVVNRLSPSNIKRTANNLLDEWEKSLAAPASYIEQADKENTMT